MLLTSNGIRNETLKSALADLVGKWFAAARVVFIPTASVAAAGDTAGWSRTCLLHGLRWREFDILELNGLPGQMVLDRLRHADVIYAEGGNHYHLANSIIANGLAEEMADILEDKVYVGVSAGSMIFSRNLSERTGEAFGEQDDLRITGRDAGTFTIRAVRLVPQAAPELAQLSHRTPAWFEKAAAKLDCPVYAIDDDSAVRVRGDEIDVVSDGEWLLLNAPAPETAGPDDQQTARPGRSRGLLAFRPPRRSRG